MVVFTFIFGYFPFILFPFLFSSCFMFVDSTDEVVAAAAMPMVLYVNDLNLFFCFYLGVLLCLAVYIAVIYCY